ncbi:hypothetical protein [Streptomyces sp. NBC_01538]|uniref:hypothetical protein n=1 Tax=Streptomyces sp. NBC_01538 TaxID=2903897 RepID=UPI00386C88EB
MTDWSTLSDACGSGSAEHVPALLDRFKSDPSGTWSELMDHLCPQLDTAFSASFAALPRLAELASGCGAEDRRWVLLVRHERRRRSRRSLSARPRAMSWTAWPRV